MKEPTATGVTGFALQHEAHSAGTQQHPVPPGVERQRGRRNVAGRGGRAESAEAVGQPGEQAVCLWRWGQPRSSCWRSQSRRACRRRRRPRLLAVERGQRSHLSPSRRVKHLLKTISKIIFFIFLSLYSTLHNCSWAVKSLIIYAMHAPLPTTSCHWSFYLSNCLFRPV